MVESDRMTLGFVRERIVSARGKRSAAMMLLWALEAVCLLPLAFLLPFSKTALLFTVGLIGATSGSILAVAIGKARTAMLELFNTISCGALLWWAAAGHPSRLVEFSLVAAAVCAAVVVVGVPQLPAGPARAYLAAQQGALASTLISWALVQQLRSHLGISPAAPLPDPMAFRFLFLGPLAFAAFVFLSGFRGWNRYLFIWSTVCLGQFAIGLLDLAGYLNATPLKVIAFTLVTAFALLLALSFAPTRVLNALLSRRAR